MDSRYITEYVYDHYIRISRMRCSNILLILHDVLIQFNVKMDEYFDIYSQHLLTKSYSTFGDFE